MANKFARKLRKTLTPQELKLWVRLRELRELGHHFRRQVPLQGFIVDFVCFSSRLAIEIDGGQHNQAQALTRDHQRDQQLRKSGLTVLRFWNNEIDTNLNGVLERIAEHLSTPTPARSARRPSPQGGGKRFSAI